MSIAFTSPEFRDLIQRARDGDSDALEAIIEHLRPSLVERARGALDSRLKARVDPSDVVQLTCLEACNDFQSFGGKQGIELFGWATSILHNNVANSVRDHVQTQKRTVKRERSAKDADECRQWHSCIPSPDSTPSTTAIRRESHEALEAAIRDLPADQREAIRLRHLKGYSLTDLATHFCRSEQAVAGLLKRAMRKLRVHFEASSEDE